MPTRRSAAAPRSLRQRWRQWRRHIEACAGRQWEPSHRGDDRACSHPRRGRGIGQHACMRAARHSPAGGQTTAPPPLPMQPYVADMPLHVASAGSAFNLWKTQLAVHARLWKTYFTAECCGRTHGTRHARANKTTRTIHMRRIACSLACKHACMLEKSMLAKSERKKNACKKQKAKTNEASGWAARASHSEPKLVLAHKCVGKSRTAFRTPVPPHSPPARPCPPISRPPSPTTHTDATHPPIQFHTAVSQFAHEL
eukprot:363384-Chlamydomonas_euryale.AAC.1